MKPPARPYTVPTFHGLGFSKQSRRIVKREHRRMRNGHPATPGGPFHNGGWLPGGLR